MVNLQSPSSIKVPKNFMSFGKGIGSCPTTELASLELAVFLHHLTLKYDWELAEHDCPVKMPFIKFTKGLPIRVLSNK